MRTFSSTLRVGKQADILERAGDAGGEDLVRRQAQQRAAAQGDCAARCADEAGDDVEQGGFAGAVGADDGDDAAGRHVDADIVESDEAAEADGDALDVEQGAGAGCPGRDAVEAAEAAAGNGRVPAPRR